MRLNVSQLPEYELAEDRIDIWLRPISTCSDDVPPDMLDEAESNRLKSMGSPLQRDKFSTGRALARAVLSHAVGRQSKDLTFNSTRNGKLILESHPEIDFNLTFANGFAAMAVTTGNQLGFDMEAWEQNFGLETIAQRFFSSIEKRKLLSTPPTRRRRPFIEIWTLKEAFIKATGDGFLASLEQLKFEVNKSGCISHQLPSENDAWSFAQLDLLPGLIGSVCLKASSISYSNIHTWLLSEDGSIEPIQPLRRCRSQGRYS